MSRFAAQSPASGSIPSLNGIRALAISLVFLSHGGLDWIIPGGLGVTMFFVLSGYLITTLMRREYAASGAIALRDFYLRRSLRLMPPLLTVVAVAALLSSISVIDGRFSVMGLLSVLFYFGNYHIIATDFDGLPQGLGVVWSLAVEEHYYLLYPPLAAMLLRIGSRRLSLTVLTLLCSAVLFWRCWLAQHGAADAYIAMATDTRADSILVGCLLASWSNPSLKPAESRRLLQDAAIAAACLCILIATLLYRDAFFRLTLRYTLQSLAIAPLIELAIARSRQAPFAWLNSRLMVYLGTISYTCYLTHQLVLYWVMDLWPQSSVAPTLAITALLTIAIAEPMRRYVEQPCARLRRQLHRRREPAATPGEALIEARR